MPTKTTLQALETRLKGSINPGEEAQRLLFQEREHFSHSCPSVKDAVDLGFYRTIHLLLELHATHPDLAKSMIEHLLEQDPLGYCFMENRPFDLENPQSDQHKVTDCYDLKRHLTDAGMDLGPYFERMQLNRVLFQLDIPEVQSNLSHFAIALLLEEHKKNLKQLKKSNLQPVDHGFYRTLLLFSKVANTPAQKEKAKTMVLALLNLDPMGNNLLNSETFALLKPIFDQFEINPDPYLKKARENLERLPAISEKITSVPNRALRRRALSEPPCTRAANPPLRTLAERRESQYAVDDFRDVLKTEECQLNYDAISQDPTPEAFKKFFDMIVDVLRAAKIQDCSKLYNFADTCQDPNLKAFLTSGVVSLADAICDWWTFSLVEAPVLEELERRASFLMGFIAEVTKKNSKLLMNEKVPGDFYYLIHMFVRHLSRLTLGHHPIFQAQASIINQWKQIIRPQDLFEFIKSTRAMTEIFIEPPRIYARTRFEVLQNQWLNDGYTHKPDLRKKALTALEIGKITSEYFRGSEDDLTSINPFSEHSLRFFNMLLKVTALTSHSSVTMEDLSASGFPIDSLERPALYRLQTMDNALISPVPKISYVDEAGHFVSLEDDKAIEYIKAVLATNLQSHYSDDPHCQRLVGLWIDEMMLKIKTFEFYKAVKEPSPAPVPQRRHTSFFHRIFGDRPRHAQTEPPRRRSFAASMFAPPEPSSGEEHHSPSSNGTKHFH